MLKGTRWHERIWILKGDFSSDFVLTVMFTARGNEVDL